MNGALRQALRPIIGDALRTLRSPTLATIAITINATIGLILAAVLNIWQDEAYTLHTTAGSLSYAYTQALRFEQNAPLYFVLLNLWRHIDGSLFFARLFSVLCVTISLALVPRLAERYLPRINPGLVTLAIALNPWTIWAAVDARVYAMIILLSALLLIFFYDAFISEDAPHPWRATLLYAFFTAIALYTQYYLGFLVAGQAIALVVFARSRIPRYLVASVFALLLFLPIAVQLPSQMANFQGAFAAPDSPLAATGTILDILGHYVIPIHTFGRPVLAIWVLAFVTIAALTALRPHLTRYGDSLLLVMTAGGAVLMSLALYTEHIHVLDRHLAPLFLPIVLSMFSLFTYVRDPARARAVLIWACASVAISIFTLGTTYYSLAKRGDWIRVNAYLRGHEAPGQPIVVFEAENALPLSYYYRGPNRIVPIPTAVNFSDYDVSSFVIRSVKQMSHVMPATRTLWFITAGECNSANIDFGCDFVDQYLATHYRVLSTQQFYGATVRLLAKKS